MNQGQRTVINAFQIFTEGITRRFEKCETVGEHIRLKALFEREAQKLKQKGHVETDSINRTS